MGELTIECLCCGQVRAVAQLLGQRVDPGECSRCGYLGWAPSRALDEVSRRLLRDRPLAKRRLRQVA
jgi:hypothetical protein